MDQHSGSAQEASVIASQEPRKESNKPNRERGDMKYSKKITSWLASAPVRNTDASQKRYGAFNHGVHEKTGRVPGQYTEITGYGISTFAHLYRWYQDPAYLKIAQEAAAFLLKIQHSNGAYPHCPDPEQGCEQGELFTFDTSMCTMGVMDLYNVDPREEYLDSARKAGEWLISMQRADGAFKAKATVQAGHTNTGNFFGDGSCIHVKNAMALLKVADVTGDTHFDEAARKICDYVLKLQDYDGLFWAMPTKNFVFTHAHCYACEGFISAGAYTGEERYTQAALKGIEWLRKSQNSDGSVFQVYADHRGLKHKMRQTIDAFKAADATSQAARLFKLAGPAYDENYERALGFIKSHMLSEQGGLYYTKGRFRTNHMMFAWPAMFAVQAFEYARQDKSPKDLY